MIPCTKILKGRRSAHNENKCGPLVVWNLTSRCNLSCRHCYRDSALAIKGQEAELSDDKCITLAAEIKELNPPIVLLSGGEPLLRRNIFEIVKVCKALGLRVGLSTNGTLIDRAMADKIRQSNFDYVGISIDGKAESHDKLRGLSGASEASWQALGLLNKLGVKTGVRFTLTKANRQELMDILERTWESGSKRFCLYHLVYAGRAAQELDISSEEKRFCLDEFFKKIKEISLIDSEFEALTTDSPADGMFLSRFVIDEQASLSCIRSHGGCSAGERVVYLDSTGEVYPCQFLRGQALGNVLEKPLTDIWTDNQNTFLRQLRNKKNLLTGKCGKCTHKEICGGCRARAKACYGSLWAEDPGCYLEDSLIRKEVFSEQL